MAGNDEGSDETSARVTCTAPYHDRSSYNQKMCTCEIGRADNAKYQRWYRAWRKANGDPIPHFRSKQD